MVPRMDLGIFAMRTRKPNKNQTPRNSLLPH
jgi:hypothetical protein